MTTLKFDSNHAGVSHLRAADPVLAGLIDAVGPFDLELADDRFADLAGSIVSQQLSTSAARTIWGRFVELAGTVTPDSIERLAEEELRAVGLSGQKARYLKDLAQRVKSGEVDLDAFDEHSDEEVIVELTKVKGIGRWTAEMFLIFSLGREDVFAADDVGLQRAVRLAYGDTDADGGPSASERALAWAPYRSVASLYLWKALDRKVL
ncbi:MAG TPA: DNA-3-methyladenine glycosylase [Coriobacteriia bacterium]|nr:DNA-3-methyladenine glycosylase [Coriobacteriia bacterium]